MKLVSARIKNFRSIKDSLIEFEPACRVLVGINESGKSNVLKALRLLSDNFQSSRDDVRERVGSEGFIREAYVRFQYRLEKADTNRLKTEMAKLILCRTENPFIARRDGSQLTLDSFCISRASAPLYEVNLLTELRQTEYWALPSDIDIAPGWAKPSETCPEEYRVPIDGGAAKLKAVKLIRQEDFPNIPAEYLASATTADLEGFSGDAILGIAEGQRPQVVFWEYDDKQLLPNSVDIAAFAEEPGNHEPLKNMFILAGIAESEIAASIKEAQGGSLNQFQNYLNHIAERTTKHFQSVWKEYRGISFSLGLNGAVIVPGVKESNTHDFARRSDGFKRFVTFLLLISAKVESNQMRDSLLIIDEPEISLHPSGARYLRDELLNIAKRNYVVYSTHSIFMIDSEETDRHYLVRKKGEVTTLEPARESNIVEEEVLWNALGYSAFSVLKERNLVFEGWKDKRLFEIATGNLPNMRKKFKGVGVANAKGASTIKYITPLLQLANRDCVIVSDADGPALSEQKRYRADNGFGKWLTYRDIDASLVAITGEDFVKKSAIAKAVNSVLADLSLPKFTEAHLPVDADRLKVLKSWLAENGIAGSQLKDTTDAIKNQVFETLTFKDIEPIYIKLLEGLPTQAEQAEREPQ